MKINAAQYLAPWELNDVIFLDIMAMEVEVILFQWRRSKKDILRLLSCCLVVAVLK